MVLLPLPVCAAGVGTSLLPKLPPCATLQAPGIVAVVLAALRREAGPAAQLPLPPARPPACAPGHG
jgi:hypothetical protein